MSGAGRLLSAASRHPAAPYAVLGLVSCLLYVRTAAFGFLFTWDDAGYVLDNPLVVQPFSFEVLRALFTTEVMGNYAPLQILAYALEYGLWGASPAGYHLVNSAVHAANACLVFAVVGGITERRRLAFWAAMLFAVHPVNVENVAWISESKSLFAACFGLLALFLYLRHLRGGRTGALVLAAATFAAGLFFKVSIVPLPLILVAVALLRGHRGRAAWLPAIPFFLLAGGAAAMAVWAQAQSGAVEQGVLRPDFLFGTVYPTMVPVLARYLGLLLLPVGLSGYYDTTIHHSFLDLPVLLTLGATAAAIALIVLKGSGPVRFWSFWFGAFLLPVANIVPLPVYYADRYLYLPSIGFFVLLGVAAGRLVQQQGISGRATNAVAAAAAVVLAVMAFNRLEVWRNDLVFWEDTARSSPGLYKPRLNLGIAYDMAGRYADAERELLASLAIRPTEKARYNLAVVRAKLEYERSRAGK